MLNAIKWQPESLVFLMKVKNTKKLLNAQFSLSRTFTHTLLLKLHCFYTIPSVMVLIFSLLLDHLSSL